MMWNNFLIILFSFLILAEGGEISQRKCAEYLKFTYKETCTFGLYRSCRKVPSCSQSQGLIVGGTQAGKHEFPHFVLIGYGGEFFKCGGTILSEKFVMTASHCKQDNDKVEASLVRVGEHLLNAYNAARRDHEIEEFIAHRRYNSENYLNDIALIKVKTPIQFNLDVHPACLHQYRNEVLKNQTAIAIGFGALGFAEESSNVLMKVNLTVIAPNRCQGDLEKSQSQICVKGTKEESGDYGDTCGGDSGGPIQRRQVNNTCAFDVIGITSHGKVCGKGYGAVYTRVAFFLPWIEEVVWGQN